MQSCSKCGTKLIDEERVCSFCGANLGINDISEEMEEFSDIHKKTKGSVYDELLKVSISMISRPITSIEKFCKELTLKSSLILSLVLALVSGGLFLWFLKSLYMKMENIITSIPLFSGIDSIVYEYGSIKCYILGTFGTIILFATLFIGICLACKFIYNSKVNILVIYNGVVCSSIIIIGGFIVSIVAAYLSIQLSIILVISALAMSSVCLYSGIKANMDINEDETAYSIFCGYIINFILIYILISIFLK